MDRFLQVLTVAGVLLALVILRSVRRQHVRVEYSVSWLAAAAVILIVSFSGRFLGRLAQAIGVQETPLAVVILLMMVFLGVFYRFSVVVSDLKDTNIALIQRVAILEYRLEKTNGQEIQGTLS